MKLLLATLVFALAPLPALAGDEDGPKSYERVTKIPIEAKAKKTQKKVRQPKKKPGPGETLIWGRVLDHAGKPRTGGVVNVVLGPVSPLERAYPGFAEDDSEGLERLEEDGTFEIVRKIPDGRHLVKALIDEGDNLRVAVGEVLVSDHWSEPLTLRLKTPVQLRGVVTDTAKKPLAGVPLAIVAVPPSSLGGEAGLRRPSPGTLSHVESQKDGRFVFDPVDPGRYAVFPIGATWGTAGNLIVHAGDKASLIISKKPVLRAEVVDAEGHPISVFRARLDDEPAGYFRQGKLELALARRHPGPGVLELQAPEHPSYIVPQSIPLGSGDDLDLGKLELPSGRDVTVQLRGLVKGPNVSRSGAAREDSDDLAIRVFSGEGSKRVEEPHVRLPEPKKSSGSLTYVLKGLPDGPVDLLLEAPGRAPLFLKVKGSETEARAIFRRGSSVELTLLTEQSMPLPEATVHLRQVLEGIPFLQKGESGPYGRLRFSGLIGGEATVRITAKGQETVEETIVLPKRGKHSEVITVEKKKAPPAPAPGTPGKGAKAP